MSSSIEEVANKPEEGDVVRMRCGRVSYRVADPFPLEGSGVVAERSAVEAGVVVLSRLCVAHFAWIDLLRYGAVSVERRP